MKKAIFLTLGLLAPAALAVGCGGSGGYNKTGSAVSFLVSPPSGSTLPSATIGAPYSATFTVLSGGTAPYSFGGVALPAGLTITQVNTNTATLSGTPTQSGQGVLQFAVADAAQNSEVENYVLTVSGGANTLAITPATLGPYTAGQPLSQTLTTTGTAPFTWSVSGTLPTGVNLGSSSVATDSLSGTLLRRGTFTFTIMTQDATGATGSVAYTVTVN